TSDILFQDFDPIPLKHTDPLAGTPQIWLVNNTSVTSQTILPNPGTNMVIVGTGDFNGDGDADILFRDTVTGSVEMWEMKGTSIVADANLGTSTLWAPVAVGDFNGDGRSDILWKDTSGNLAMWEMNGPTRQLGAIVGNIGAGSTVVGVGDFNADGRSDFLW